MYASVPDSLRKLAKKIGADVIGGDTEDIINAITVKLGGTPVRRKGISRAIDSITEVVDLDVMHNLTTLSVTPSTTAQDIEPESPVDGYSSVSIAAVTAAIDENIIAGNIKKDVQILGVTGSYEGAYNATLAVDGTTFTYNDAALTSISIPNGITSIGEYAFLECTSLTGITIPNSVTSIGGGAFNGCTGLTNIVIPNGITTIDGETFSGCTSLTDITIPNNVTSIGGYAFNGCTGLTNIVIPNSVTTIDDTTFDGCINLTTITVHKAEGSIADAPWGATNATVVWDG